MGILNKTQYFANGKVVLCDFKKLDKNYFIRDEDKVKTGAMFMHDTLAATRDGKIYINSRGESPHFLAELCALLAESDIESLMELEKLVRQKYPFVSHENIAETTQDAKEQTFIFAVLAIPMELKRREFEKAYYDIK